MPPDPSDKDSSGNKTSIARSIQLELARRGMSRKELVALSSLSTSTIDKALAGSFSAGTLARIEAVLGRPFGEAESTAAASAAAGDRAAAIAPEAMGAYTRAAVRHYIGQYLTLRPAFNRPGRIVAYSTELYWDDARPCLAFRESNKVDGHHQHQGSIHLPAASTYLYLVSLTTGAMRMVLVSQLGPRREMRGLITTLANPMGSVYIPASAPIVYLRKENLDDCAFGHLQQGDRDWEAYHTILRKTVDDTHVRWAAP